MANDEDKGKWFLPLFGGMVVLTLAIAIFIGVEVPGDATTKLKLSIGWGALVLVFLFGFVILAAIASGKIDITELLEDDTGGASTSRFQLLIFTFVIGLSFVLIVASSGKFPDVPADILALLGISASTYGVSKGIAAGAKSGGGSASDSQEKDDSNKGK